MKRNLIIFLVCILVCLCAYRFGGTAKENIRQGLFSCVHEEITDFVFPVLRLYRVPKGQNLSMDIGNVILPMLGTVNQMGNAHSSSAERFPLAPEEEDEIASDKMNNGSDADSGNKEPSVSETEEEGPGLPHQSERPSQSEQSSQDGDASRDESPSESEPDEPNTPDTEKEVLAFAGLTKKVVINRVKLQDFDYLRQKFYQIDSTTTIGSQQLNAEKLLEKDVTISKHAKGPQVLIYHTHSQEGYKDSKAGDESTGVVGVGAYLAELLTEVYGIEVLHHTASYDKEDHASSYSNALPHIKEILKQNPSIEVVIDLHRDGVEEGTHLVTEINGKKTAKIMFFNGLSRTTAQGELSYLKNPYLEDNLAFSFQMQLAAEEYFPGFARRIYLKGYRYNMHLCPKTLLVEVGAQTNTVQEAKNAMEPLALLLGNVLKYR